MAESETVNDPLGALRAGVDTALEIDLADLSDGELVAHLLRLRREMDRLDAAIAALTSAADRRGPGSLDR